MKYFRQLHFNIKINIHTEFVLSIVSDQTKKQTNKLPSVQMEIPYKIPIYVNFIHFPTCSKCKKNRIDTTR